MTTYQDKKNPPFPSCDRWWIKFGLKKNPYVYGPMPWKRTGERFRLDEARRRGWVAWHWNDGMTNERFHSTS